MAQKFTCIDLFCGVGGLSFGLRRAGFEIAAGVDFDGRCEYPFQENIGAKFLHKDISQVEASDLRKHFRGAEIKVLVGCAPCQPFSSYSNGGKSSQDWRLLLEFGRLCVELKPDYVSMENVPGLAKHSIFEEFVSILEEAGYSCWYDPNVKCADYGVPQTRTRMVLLASKNGDAPTLKTVRKRKDPKSVRQTISSLPPLASGGHDDRDRLHRASELSSLNLSRVRNSKPGGTWRDWPTELVAECHKKKSGATYPSVYGRMEWDKPSPTITTQSYGYGNGRFGHPTQDRAISLREAAMLQGFPKYYQFVPRDSKVEFTPLGKLIGNAVPPQLGSAIGKAIRQHEARNRP